MNPKSVVLLALAIASFLNGAVGQYYYPDASHPPSNLWFLGIFALLVFTWYRLDTNQRSYRRTPLLSVGVVALAVIALPYYFFRSRGVKGGFIALGQFVFAVICSGVLTIAGNYLVYYAMQS